MPCSRSSPAASAAEASTRTACSADAIHLRWHSPAACFLLRGRSWCCLGGDMAEMKPGRIVEWRRLSPSLSLFRVLGPEGARFPSYEAGQYIALRRDDCLLTRKV